MLGIAREVALLKNKQNKNQRFKSVLSHNKDGIYEHYLVSLIYFLSRSFFFYLNIFYLKYLTVLCFILLMMLLLTD